jgi:hypothetical protein
VNKGSQGLEIDHGISQGRLDRRLRRGAQGVGNSRADAEQHLSLDGHAYQHVPGTKTDGALKESRLEGQIDGRGSPQIEDPLPRNEHVVKHHDGIHLIPGWADRMVRGIWRRERLATDDVDAFGVHRRRKVHPLLRREVGPWRCHAEKLVGIGGLRSHSFGPAHDDSVGTPRHDPQGLLLGHRVIAMMQGVAEHRRDAEIILAAVLEIAGHVSSKGGVLLAQEVADIVEPEHHGRQVLR